MKEHTVKDASVIDADAHVIENESAWDYMLESERQFKPKIVGAANGDASVDFWYIDGRLMPRSNVEKKLPQAAREMSDLSVRIKHMDELDIDIQVIYPTIFIFPTARRPEADLALCRSYNRWMADIVKQVPDRFRWVVIPPLLNMDRVRDELQFGKENGACGIYLRGLEADRRLSDAYFFPLYHAASELDLPICVHSANGSIALHDFFLDEPGFCKFKLAVVGAFHSLVNDGIPERFPKLRLGIIEVSAQWIPYALHDLARRHARRGKQLSHHPLKDKRIYVTCQTDDDLDYILGYAGEDNLVIGTDYGHSDNASEIEALRKIQQDGKLSAPTVNKILNTNPRALYGL
jgi:predicted TIM-barrel fold metal-dependent hydrolase